LPTSFSTEDQSDLYQIGLTNTGTRASSNTITVTDTLPEGITTAALPHGEEPDPGFWTCTVAEGPPKEVVTCTTEHVIAALTPTIALDIPVVVSATVPPGSAVTNVTTVSDGETLAATRETTTVIGQPPRTFELFDFSFSRLGAAGEPANEAGERPGALTAAFELPSAMSFRKGHPFGLPLPVEEVKQTVTELPPGVVGNAQAAGTCTLAELTNAAEESEGESQCPRDSRVGLLTLIESDRTYTNLVIYNMTPEHGYAAEFGVYLPILQHAILLYATLVGYGADAHVQVVSAPQGNFLNVLGASLTFFGSPGVINGVTPLDSAIPFVTNPSDCAASGFTTTMYADTWERPGRMLSDGQPDLSDAENWRGAAAASPPVTGCGALQFHPSLTLAPEPSHSKADEPAGYDATLQIPQSEGANAHATPPLKRTVVTLPPGLAISPSAANGLVGCQEVGSEGIELESPGPGHCPSASTIGTVEVTTPLLSEPLTGRVYVAQPTCGGALQPRCTEEQAEDGQLFAIYLEAGSENAGVHIKLRGTVEVGGSGRHSKEAGLALGQIRTTFAETPQQPFSQLRLSFNGGARSALANPQTCGNFTTVSDLEPWSHQPAPGEASGTPNVTVTPSFAIGGCEDRFTPAFTAGTLNPQAGGSSPFTLTLSRQDREQDFAGVTVRTPPGLLGKIAGIPQCPEAAANAGTCSSASRLGTATAAAGSGSQPLWQAGPVFLTGPYKGAPFGLSIAVPADAGPYHLGLIVVRSAIYVDPLTAALTVVSDPLPQSVDGVPLRLKTINVTIDREDFMLNPTGCEAKQVMAAVTSASGASASVASRFQAANCTTLPFRPSISASTQGNGSSRKNGASFDIKIAQKPGEAAIHKAEVRLPLALPSRLTTLQKACTESQFAANPAGCPAASTVGTATAATPLLNVALTGPAYLVSHGGAAFPDLVVLLQGEGVAIELVGNTDIKKGITYSRFNAVPDAPISSFELRLPEGQFSVLAANRNLCSLTKTITTSKKVTRRVHGRVKHRSLKVKRSTAEPLSMPTILTAQSGATFTKATGIDVTGCPKPKKASAKKRSGKKARVHHRKK
jgi:hypothetical protein